MKIYLVNAFTKDGAGGNPAGVVLGADGLSSEEMQAIAFRLSFSETAFITPSESMDQRLRFFAPLQEVHLCAHATLAAYHLLWERGAISDGHYRMETLSGAQGVEVAADGLVSMSQNLPVFDQRISAEALAPALGLQASDLSSEVPIRVVSTGLRKIFAAVKSREVLESLKFDLQKVELISKANQAIGVYVFSLEDDPEITAYCRNCAPVVGIKEDSATGTSAAALACHLFNNGVILPAADQFFRFYQGFSIGEPSELLVRLKVESGSIQEVRVAGKCVTIREIGREEIL